MTEKSNVEKLADTLRVTLTGKFIAADLDRAIKADNLLRAQLDMHDEAERRTYIALMESTNHQLIAKVERLEEQWQKEREFGTSKAEEVMHLTEEVERLEAEKQKLSERAARDIAELQAELSELRETFEDRVGSVVGRALNRARKAEAKLAKVRALVDEWDQEADLSAGTNHLAMDLRAVLDEGEA